jgi:spermidine synthase
LKRRFAEADLETRYYTPELHRAAFALPAFIAEVVEAARKEAGK